MQSGVPGTPASLTRTENIVSQVPCHFVVAGLHDLSCFSWEGLALFDEEQSKTKLRIKEFLLVFRVLYCTSPSVCSYSLLFFVVFLFLSLIIILCATVHV